MAVETVHLDKDGPGGVSGAANPPLPLSPPSPEQLRGHVEFFYSTPSSKLRRAPLRMLHSALRLGYCRLLGKVLPTRVRTFWGEPMLVMFPEQGSVALMRYGFLEPGLTALLLRVLKPGMKFFDVGAHYGYYSLLAARLVGNDGQVHAFEPSPHAWDVLTRNTNRFGNIRVNNLALYSQPGELTFNDFGVEFSEYNTLDASGRLDEEFRRKRNIQPRQIRVRAETLDRYVRNAGVRPDFVKIDAECAERQILEGMSELMRDVKPMITIEVGADAPESPGASEANIRFLEERGYVAHEWAEDELRPHRRRSSYVFDNLLFIHPEGVVQR